MKVTIYTVTDCQFSKTEKEYLTSKNIPFEEKNLETNKEYLTEMLTVSNNFAGTPVTVVDKDNGEKVVLKGYTQSEIDEALGLNKPTEAPAKEASAPPAPVEPAKPMEPAAAPVAPMTPTPEVSPVAAPTPAPVAPPAPVTVEPAAPAMPVAPAAPAANDPSLDALLNDLQSKVAATKADVAADSTVGQPPPAPEAPAAPAAPTAGGMPAVPDFGDKQ